MLGCQVSVVAVSFQQAAFKAEIYLAPELMFIQVSNAHFAGPYPRMLLFLVEGLGCLAADLDKDGTRNLAVQAGLKALISAEDACRSACMA